MLHRAIYYCLWFIIYLPLAFIVAGLLCAIAIWLTGWNWLILFVPILAITTAYQMVKSRVEDIEMAGFKQSAEQMANRMLH